MRHWSLPAVVLCCAAGSSFADVLRLEHNALSSGGGGEFTATPISGDAGMTGDNPTALNPFSFETFCLEYHEPFRSGDVYNVTINTAAVLGGGGAVNGADPLDDRTAFLYTRFRAGSLTGFDYGAGRLTSSAALQQAIWYIEEEDGGAANAFVALANAAVAPGGEWFGMGLGDVRVLNLSNAEFPHAQDQLTIIHPIPAPGAAGLVGLAGLALLRRRR